MDGLFEVFFSGRELKGSPSPRSSAHGLPGATSAGVEAYEEQRINSQVMGYMLAAPALTQEPAPADLHNLPDKGRCDDFLRPGRSAELLHALPSIFKNDPPVNCGAHSELVGLSCAYRERYAAEVFSPAAVSRHLQLARGFWQPTPQDNVANLVIPPGARLIVVGDVHGQLEDVLWIFFKYGPPSASNQYLFNGDIVDRGGHSLEILLLLLAIKRDDPASVHLQRGNHEDLQCGIHFGFRAELQSKFGFTAGGTVWNLCCNVVFPLLPIVSSVLGPLTGGRRFCVLHGGIPVDCPGQTRPVSVKDDLGRLNRLVTTVQATSDLSSHILFNLLWADPAEASEGKRAGNHGRGNRFVEKDTAAFCEANEIAFIVRSHEVPRSLRGAVAMHGGKCFTVFSASNYMGSTGNRGGVFMAEVGKGLQLKEHSAPPFHALADIYASNNLYTANLAERLQEAEQMEKQSFAQPEGEAAAGASPRPPSGPASMGGSLRSNAEAQLQQFVMERICEQKDQLFIEFRGVDYEMSGLLPRAQWAEVMHKNLSPLCPEVLTPPVLDRLAVLWGLGDPVGYVRFLHRFQIRGPDEDGSAPDLMREVSKLRRKLLDAPAQSLEQLLDPNGDRSVSRTEFVNFLPQFNIDVPLPHAGALYEQMSSFVQQDPMTVDSAVLCLAIMSRDPPPVNRWSPIAEKIGSEIARAGKSYAYAFRFWDTDRDGYLSLEELQQGLRQLPATQNIDSASIVNFMSYIEGMGVSNRRVSMFEFVRAVAPRSLAMELHQTMLKEILKRVWICRPALQTLLAQADPRATSRVSVDDFRECLGMINSELEQRGRPLLSDIQVTAICEIASRGSRSVQYDRFIRGLHVVDLELAG